MTAYSPRAGLDDGTGMISPDRRLASIVSVEVMGFAPGATDAGERLQGGAGAAPDTKQVRETAFENPP
jgi:hypothetical protein